MIMEPNSAALVESMEFFKGFLSVIREKIERNADLSEYTTLELLMLSQVTYAWAAFLSEKKPGEKGFSKTLVLKMISASNNLNIMNALYGTRINESVLDKT